MCPIQKAEEAYVTPNTTTMNIALQRSILDISKPEGEVPDIDPTEG